MFWNLVIFSISMTRIVEGFDDDDGDDTDLPWLRSSHGNDYSIISLDYPGWPTSSVPVFFDRNTMDEKEINVVKSVQKDMNKKIGCIKFVPIETFKKFPEQRLKVFKNSTENGKGASVRFNDGKEFLMIIKMPYVNDTRYNHMVLTHEFLHVIGLAHTHMRSDRDKYIRVLNENIKKEKRSQYDVCKDCKLLTSKYDCKSIMHYRRCRYGKTTCDDPKFESKDPENCNLKDLNYDMSESDIESARMLNCGSKLHKKPKRRRRKRF